MDLWAGSGLYPSILTHPQPFSLHPARLSVLSDTWHDRSPNSLCETEVPSRVYTSLNCTFSIQSLPEQEHRLVTVTLTPVRYQEGVVTSPQARTELPVGFITAYILLQRVAHLSLSPMGKHKLLQATGRSGHCSPPRNPAQGLQPRMGNNILSFSTGPAKTLSHTLKIQLLQEP